MRFLSMTTLAIVMFALVKTAAAQPVFPHPGGDVPANAPSGQQATLITKLTPEDVAKLFSQASIPSEVMEDDKHNKMVVVQFWGKDLYSGVITEHCEKDGSGCRTLEIFANFGKSPNVNQAWLNAWNGSKIGVKAFRTESNDLIFEFDLPLFSGVTPDYIVRVAKFFKVAVDSSSDFKP
jgi:Putative bacterial sensory transduction regulator